MASFISYVYVFLLILEFFHRFSILFIINISDNNSYCSIELKIVGKILYQLLLGNKVVN